MATEEDQAALPQLLYLGPLGTYTHQVRADNGLNRVKTSHGKLWTQVAYENLADNVTYVQRDTIREVFESISPEFPYGVIPQENSTYGSVIDTYDSLRSPRAGTEVFVRGDITLAVQHCLVGRNGLDRTNIKRILSHEQALGQCRDYLYTNFPEATLKKVSSTAVAAQSLTEDDADIESAAICSALCVKLFSGLEILQRSIQDKQDNFTRFFVLSHSLESMPPLLDTKFRLLRALVRISMPPAPSSGSHEADSGQQKVQCPAAYSHNRPLHLVMSTLLTTFGVPITRIDRRPSLSDVPFEDLYFVELEELGSPMESPPRAERLESWATKVNSGVKRVKAAGGEATILGVW
ncbi:Prephenate dehydratase-domain-containing protein [Irpex rosettiformis]|uniref:Prephenate dehydratase-domain-containing protein n=1 Tax=Irpex rosettiformis TaxID=378272 RepID=A0ACB8UKD9_9APHY|nr:Prephenate dehydratase-domain-containing protein [Irpex rosettiformis]